MLQVPNILKKPIIMIPPTVAGIVLAPFGTVWFGLISNDAGAGMGTSGFVGQIMTFESMELGLSILCKYIVLLLVFLLFIFFVFAGRFCGLGWYQSSSSRFTYD